MTPIERHLIRAGELKALLARHGLVVSKVIDCPRNLDRSANLVLAEQLYDAGLTIEKVRLVEAEQSIGPQDADILIQTKQAPRRP